VAKKTAFWAVPDDAEIRAILMDRIDVQRRGVGLVVGVVNKDGRRIVAYGKTSKSDDRTPDGDTLFEIGSVTKTFTSLLLSDMVERGEIALDDPAANHCPQA
jgi:D-alanyl-D-alanine-carboxypeptidase/D-alanyl-D-alanine-endopeptidase